MAKHNNKNHSTIVADANYGTDISIDPNALDVEWLKQTNMFSKYSRALAEAEKKKREVKRKLEVTRAERYLEIVKKAKDKKPTKDEIESQLSLDEECTEVNGEYLNVLHKVDILSSAVKACEQKKTSLENLVRLMGQNYFSTPSDPRDLGFEWDKNLKRKEVERVTDEQFERKKKRKRKR